MGHFINFWDWSETKIEGTNLFVTNEFSISSTKSQKGGNQMNRKPFLVALAELIAAYLPHFGLGQRRWLCQLLPTPGNVLFTLLMVGGLLWATSAGALPFRAPALAGDSTTTISYQGRPADSPRLDQRLALC
jgi:hypothetical protein